MSCPRHPQSYEWPSATGLRCAICGHRLDGSESKERSEEPEVRSFAYYRELVGRTDHGKFGIEYFAGCLCEEAGEFFGKVKKVVWHEHLLDDAMREKMREELGDVLWYLDRCAQRLELTLDEVAQQNTVKLRKRYPDGFSTEASRDREGGELSELEDAAARAAYRERWKEGVKP